MNVAARGQLNTRETVNHALVFLVTGAVWVVGVLAALGAGPTWLSFATALFGAFPVILVHELGHALAAWAVGWRVWIVHVAPFAWRLRPFSLQLMGKSQGPDVGGFVLATPLLPRHNAKWRDAFVGAGGPLASWLMAVVCIGVSSPSVGDGNDVEAWRSVLYALGLFSLAGAIGSSLPLVGRDGRGNDAANIQARLDGRLRAPSHAFWALSLWTYGIEPGHWDDGLRASVEAARGTPALAEVPAYFDFTAAVRRGDSAAARTAMVPLGATWTDEEIEVLETYVRAALNDDAGAAEALMARTPVVPGGDAELTALRELALVEVERLNGDARAARKRLTRLRVSLTRQAIGRQPHWSDLIGAALGRLGA